MPLRCFLRSSLDRRPLSLRDAPHPEDRFDRPQIDLILRSRQRSRVYPRSALWWRKSATADLRWRRLEGEVVHSATPGLCQRKWHQVRGELFRDRALIAIEARGDDRARCRGGDDADCRHAGAVEPEFAL